MTTEERHSRVLLLEDDPDLAEAVEMLLEGDGYEVVITPDGAEALVLAAQQRFDVAIADLQVETLSGAAVWRVLGDLAPIPVIAMSASSTSWQEDAFRVGVSACLPKPFDADALVALVRSVVLGARSHPAGPGDVASLSDDDLQRLRAMSEEEKDRLPYGLIRVDDEGIIVGFNDYEAEASGFARDDVIGRPFSEVAPCVKVKKLADALDAAIEKPLEPHVVRFRFPRRGAVALVTVRAFYDEAHGQLWVFVSQRRGSKS